MNYKDELKVKKRKKTMAKIILAAILSLAAAGGLIYFLFFGEKFDVRIIKISGDTRFENEVASIANQWLDNKRFWVRRRANIIFISSKDITAHLLTSLPQLTSVGVNKKSIHELELIVSDREAAGVWCLTESNSCFFFDNEGVAYQKSVPSTGFLITTVSDRRVRTVELGEKVDLVKWLENIILTKKSMGENGVDISEFIIPSGSFDEFHAVTRSGWRILFSVDSDISKQISSFDILIDQLTPLERAYLEYVDLRIQDRIYYK